MKKLVLVVAFSVAMLGNAVAMDAPFWIFAGKSEDGKGNGVFYDGNNIRGNDAYNTRHVWSVTIPGDNVTDIVRQMKSASEEQQPAFVSNSVAFLHPTPYGYTIYCSTETIKADGSTADAIPVPPGTPAAEILTYACAQKLAPLVTPKSAPKKTAPSNTSMKL